MESRDMASGEHHENQVEQSSERKGPATIGDYRRNAAPPLYNTLVNQKWWGTPSYGPVCLKRGNHDDEPLGLGGFWSTRVSDKANLQDPASQHCQPWIDEANFFHGRAGKGPPNLTCFVTIKGRSRHNVPDIHQLGVHMNPGLTLLWD